MIASIQTIKMKVTTEYPIWILIRLANVNYTWQEKNPTESFAERSILIFFGTSFKLTDIRAELMDIQ